MLKTIFLAIIIGLIAAFLGLLWGAWYGGNYGFFSFMGLKGYEAGGLFCAIMGFILGGGLTFFFIYTKK